MQTTSTSSSPVAYIAVGRDKNRLKIYGSQKVYLQDGQEFLIELFNPTTETIGAKVIINGKAISERMIVLRPGSREWLKRHIDQDSKFVFNTYSVEDSKEAKAAIANNGFVKVEFYREQKPLAVSGTGTITISGGGLWSQQGGSGQFYPPYYGTTCNDGVLRGSSLGITGNSGPVGISGSSGTTTNLCANTTNYVHTNLQSFTCDTSISCTTDSVHEDKSIETGRIEAGAASGQSFGTYNGTFECWSFANSEYQILPVSHEPVETTKLRQYCGGCGTRIRKSSHKFCNQCGTKLD